MTQVQEEIPIRFLDGSEATIHRSGNNAAWICACGYPIPILGYSDVINSEKDYTIVACPSQSCNRRYRVVAPGFKGVPTHVSEIQ